MGIRGRLGQANGDRSDARYPASKALKRSEVLDRPCRRGGRPGCRRRGNARRWLGPRADPYFCSGLPKLSHVVSFWHHKAGNPAQAGRPSSIAGNHSWRCSSVSNTISGWQARLCTLSVNAESPFGSFASWASGPGFLTRRIGNPSPSGVESGFPAIPESLLDHHYFPHEYVLGRTATHLLCVAAHRAAGQPGSA